MTKHVICNLVLLLLLDSLCSRFDPGALVVGSHADVRHTVFYRALGVLLVWTGTIKGLRDTVEGAEARDERKAPGWKGGGQGQPGCRR